MTPDRPSVEHEATPETESGIVPIRRALLSVYDKTGLVDFAMQLRIEDVELISTGGTCRALDEAGIKVTPVEKITDFPEMLDGRVKTLHPKIMAGILADRRNPEHMEAIAEHGIEPIDLVCVNLYPFEETVASTDDAEAIVEMIDIGGPSMLRAAAKNHASVAVVTSPDQYSPVAIDVREQGGLDQAYRRQLAGQCFDTTAHYEAAINRWFNFPRLP